MRDLRLEATPAVVCVHANTTNFQLASAELAQGNGEGFPVVVVVSVQRCLARRYSTRQASDVMRSSSCAGCIPTAKCPPARSNGR
eukprot:6491218-Amphidinium_carterae.1